MSLLAAAAPDVASREARSSAGRAKRVASTFVFGCAAVFGVLVLLAALAPLVGMRLVVLETGSMSPDLPAGSVLLDRDTPASEVRPGDVVTVMRADGSPVTHRVVTVAAAGEGASLVLKGDANDTADPTPYVVTRVGLVLGGVPWGGGLLGAAASPAGVPVLAGAVSLLVLWAWWPARRGPAHRNESR